MTPRLQVAFALLGIALVTAGPAIGHHILSNQLQAPHRVVVNPAAGVDYVRLRIQVTRPDLETVLINLAGVVHG